MSSCQRCESYGGCCSPTACCAGCCDGPVATCANCTGGETCSTEQARLIMVSRDCTHCCADGHGVTVPTTGTFLVVDGEPIRVNITEHLDPYEHNGRQLPEWWEVTRITP